MRRGAGQHIPNAPAYKQNAERLGDHHRIHVKAAALADWRRAEARGVTIEAGLGHGDNPAARVEERVKPAIAISH